jgi:hypothetical protein
MEEAPIVVWHQYGTEYAAGLDFKRVNNKRRLKSCSAFRITSRDRRNWYVAIVGLEENVEKAVGYLKHYQMRLKEAPETGMDAALVNRWARHLAEAIQTGEPIGHRHYEGGKEIDVAGRLHEREEGGS